MSFERLWVRWITRANHILILLIFFTSTWWWRPRWLMADWAPSFFRDGLSASANSDAYRQVYFSRFALTTLIVLALILWGLTLFRGIGRFGLDRRIWWLVGLLVLVIWIRLSVEWAEVQRAVAISQSSQWFLVLGFVVLVTYGGPSPRLIATALMAGMVFHAIIGITQVALQRDIGIYWLDENVLGLGVHIYEFPLDPMQSGISVVQSGGVRYLRAYGLTSHPNLFAGGLVMGLMAGSWLWLRLRRTAAWMTVVGLWALLMTFSRASMGGFVVGGAIVLGLWWVGRYWHWKMVAGLFTVVAMVGVIFYLFFQPLVEVRAGRGDEGAASVEGISVEARRVYREQAQDIIRRAPWKGIGIGNFPWVSHQMLLHDERNLDLQGDNVHHIYYLAIAEVGIIGGAIIVIIFGAACLVIWKRWRSHALTPEAIGLWAGVCAWLAIGWFEFFPWALFPYQVLFWGAMAAALVPVERVDGSNRVASVEDHNDG